MLLSRMPIFDRVRQVCGYKLIYDIPDSSDGFGCNRNDLSWVTILASASTMNSGFSNGRALINYHSDEKLRIETSVETTDAVLNFKSPLTENDKIAIADLKNKGFEIAVSYSELIDFDADIIVVDVSRIETERELKNVVDSLKKKNKTTLALKVNTLELLDHCCEAGFDYFVGRFFLDNRFSEAKDMTPTQVSRLELLSLLQNDDYDLDELSRLIEKDVSISFRLLRFLNSPTFGLSNKISSVRQAVTLAGWDMLKGWLKLSVLSEMDPSPKGMHLSYASAQRGHFLETLSERLGTESKRESFFLLGLFSLLDILLDKDMEEILSDIPIDEDIKLALCRKPGPYGIWLDFVESLDSGDWGRFRLIAADAQLDVEKVNEDYFDSVMWADSFFHE